MLERPDLDDQTIHAALHRAYGIAPANVTFLPIGYDANAWVFEIRCDDGCRYFLKARQGHLYAASLAVPSYLSGIGVEQIVAPIQTQSAELWTEAGQFNLILYPFIDGGSGGETGMSDDHWREFGRVLKQIHSTTLPEALFDQVQQETFSPNWAEMVRQLQAKLVSGDFSGPHEEALAAFWLARQQEIERIVRTTMELGRSLRTRSLPNVLCHADAHIFNILIDSQGRFHIVDWDGIILAPKERDLMFMLSSGTDEDAGNGARSSFVKATARRMWTPRRWHTTATSGWYRRSEISANGSSSPKRPATSPNVSRSRASCNCSTPAMWSRRPTPHIL